MSVSDGMAFALGAIIGSFLNVCIVRLPWGGSVVSPGSHCPACATKIRAIDNIPILSYLFLLGRCRSCRSRISPRYPLVEALNAAGYVLLLHVFGPIWPTVIYALLYSALLVVTFIDLEHQIIPDKITLPGMVLGLIFSATVLPVGWRDAFFGLFLGGALFWGLAVVSEWWFGQEGMGGGDIKLIAMIGAFLGWRDVLLTIFLAALIGSVGGIAAMLIQGKGWRSKYQIPFGPYLAAGALIALFCDSEILAWYGRFGR